MKIILSRKGFDSSNGGCPSPILPDGTLLSMPIPSDDKDCYVDLSYNGLSYSDILKQISPRKQFNHCHVDPDIRCNRISRLQDWKAGFGQIGSAQGVLQNAKVEKGDIFLFFGWFRRVEYRNNRYQYVRKNTGTFYDHADLHIIYGYMQIGDILTEKSELLKYPWHPHSSPSRIDNKTNAIYTPSENLSIVPELPGYGTLDYRQDRVLTMEDRGRGTWKELSFLSPEYVYGNRKNSAKGKGLYYGGIWQELIVYESEGLMDWVKSLLI